MDYLIHHGILGMKWGVRRYQNPDGSLTEAGRKRYNSDGSHSYEEAKLRASKNKKDRQSYESKLRGETDTRNLKGTIKAEREKEILEEANNLNASQRSTERSMELMKRIEQESGDWYNNEPVSLGFKKNRAENDMINAQLELGEKAVRDKYSVKLDQLYADYSNAQTRDSKGRIQETPKSHAAYNKYSALHDKMRNEINQYEKSDEYKKLKDRQHALKDELLGIVLKDIGYNDTPENRRLIESYVFWD